MELSGHILRHAATNLLFDHDRVLTLAEIEAGLTLRGFTVAAPAPRRLSDAMRSSVGNGRAVRHGRGRYGAGKIRFGTRRRWRLRLGWLAVHGRRCPEATMLEGIAWAKANGKWH